MTAAESLAQALVDTLDRHGPDEATGLFDRLVRVRRLGRGDGLLLAEALAWAFAEGMIRATRGGILHATAREDLAICA